ncbi:hypothetical protein Tco_0879473 [Tanacetum coccineum]
MGDPNITMEEYIRLEEEKLKNMGKCLTGKLLSMVEFGETLSCKPTVSSLNDEIDFKISFDDSDDKDYTIWLFHHVIRGTSTLGVRLWGLPDLMAEGLSTRMLMEHRDAQGQIVFTSRAAFGFGEVVTNLDTAGALQFQLGGARRRLSWRQIILALGLHTDEEMENVDFTGDFLGTTPSYTSIRDLILRLYHRLTACNIVGRSQALEKVTVTNLFYLREMDVGSVNIPYLLARYLRLFAARRKSGAFISGGQFVARLAKHFGLLTEERLRGLTVTAPTLPIIDMAELVRLQICVEIDDTWAWVALGLERQPDAAAGVLGATEDAPVVDEGDQAVSTPV